MVATLVGPRSPDASGMGPRVNGGLRRDDLAHSQTAADGELTALQVWHLNQQNQLQIVAALGRARST
jgi:hypothetical protein